MFIILRSEEPLPPAVQAITKEGGLAWLDKGAAEHYAKLCGGLVVPVASVGAFQATQDGVKPTVASRSIMAERCAPDALQHVLGTGKALSASEEQQRYLNVASRAYVRSRIRTLKATSDMGPCALADFVARECIHDMKLEFTPQQYQFLQRFALDLQDPDRS